MNVPKFPEGKRPKATDVSPWYGVYLDVWPRDLVKECPKGGKLVRTDVHIIALGRSRRWQR